MFTTHFGMSSHPFCERTPANRILKDERISEGLARLDYLTSHGTIALLTGSTGVGKSSLIKLFIHSLSKTRFRPIYIHLTYVKPSALLSLIVSALGELPRRGKDRLFMQILDKTAQSKLTTILIIDEAHLISPETLVDLRLLVSSAMDDSPPLKILLSGQEALRVELKRSCHADLIHRISVRCSLYPFTPLQTASYIDFQLRQAGASEKIFDQEAKLLIHDYTSGIPRQINNIVTACLINAASKKIQKISEQLVTETMEEFRTP